MNKSAAIILAFVCAGAVNLHAQVITHPNKRQELLSGMRDVVANTDRAAQDFSSIDSPFHERQLAVRQPEVRTEGSEPVESADQLPELLSDSAALSLIGRQFKPLGSMVLGDRGYLQLPRGRTIEKGQSFKAEIRGHTYEVTIKDVTEKSYILQLGEAELAQDFIKAGASQ